MDGIFTYQIIKLYCCDALVYTRYDLLGNGSSIDVVGVKAITKPGNPSCNLIELDTLLTSIWEAVSSQAVKL